MNTPPTSCSAGCLFGLALGDALGAETEFLSVAKGEIPTLQEQARISPLTTADLVRLARERRTWYGAR